MTELARPAAPDLVVDTSAMMAILLDEERATAVAGALRTARAPIISAATRVELSIVAAARADDPRAGADAALAVLDAADVVTMPVDQHLADEAFDAWLRFGTGSHAARLNFGDVFSYALARHWSLPLLCVGDDFNHPGLDLVDVG